MRRRITSILVIMSMVFSLIPFFSMSVSAESKPSGSGTVDDPYKIGSVEELFWFRNEVNGINGHSTAHPDICADLTADINMNDAGNWVPISGYRGNFDGRNHKVYNISCSYPNTHRVGFFSDVAYNTIKNLHIRGNFSGATYVGGLSAVTVQSNILNCSFDDGTITGTSGVYGGVLGQVHGSNVKYCYSGANASIIAHGHQGGGVIGRTWSSTVASIIEYCYNNASVTQYDTIGIGSGAVGGILGTMTDLAGGTHTVRNSYSTGTLACSDANCKGGIVGATDRVGYDGICMTVENCHTYTSTSEWVFGNDSQMRNFSASGCYALTSGTESDKTYGYYRNSTNFTKKETFNGWDFNTVWKMGASYPVLKQSVADSSKSRELVIYDNGKTNFNLPDYFDLILAENQDYHQNNRFNFSVALQDGGTYATSYESDDVTVASINNDTLTLDGSIGVGTYGPFKVQAVDTDTSNSFGTFEMQDFNITVKHAVPAPEILADNLKYGRFIPLSMFNLNDNWSWTNPLTVPKTDPNGDTYSYEAYYPFEEGKSALYDLSALDDAGISYTVDETNNRFIVNLSPKVLESDDTQQPTYIKVVNEDTNEVVAGANVSTEYADEFEPAPPYYSATDETGTAFGQLSPGWRDITVAKSGFELKTETVQIEKGTNNVTIKIRPARTAVKIPDVKELINGSDLADIPNPLVSVSRISEADTLAWLGEGRSMTASAKTELQLPPGDFVFKNATNGYSTDDKVYARVIGGVCTFYTDSNFSDAITLGEDEYYVLKAVKMNDPTYYVTIDHTEGTLDYTVDVDLKNLKAVYGAFGLRYDPAIMTLSESNITTGANIEENLTDKKIEELYPGETIPAWNTSNGYYDFVWDAKLDDDTQETLVNAETGAADIATFKFTLKSSSYESYITADSFMIEPWQDTIAAKAVKAQELKDLFSEYFRYTDGDNNPASPKEGRLAATKSAVTIKVPLSEGNTVTSTVETNGFFQARVPLPLGSEDTEKDYDVKTEIEYKFPIKNAVIRFHVYDIYTGGDLENARIRLFDSEPKLKEAKDTDYAGKASFAVNTDLYDNLNFTYDAAKKGYWSVPESGLVADRLSALAEQAKVTEVEVPMEQKVYHKPVLKKDGAGSELELVTDAELGGQKYAYNNRQYHFRVKAAKGYKITKYPTKADVYVTDKDGNTVTLYENLGPNEYGLFTLGSQYMNPSAYSVLEALDDETLTALKTNDAQGYGDWIGPQPDDEGYRGYNIVIKFDEYEAVELEYIVEGVTNDLGHVTYEPQESATVCTPKTQTDNDTDGAYEYIMVQTKNSENGGPLHMTGTFTFTGDGDNVVEAVYINGLEVDTYDDLHEFSYTFGEVDMDNNITVLFWDGVNPTDDTVMTLVVGEYGFADTVTPVAEEDIMLTRRVYLNPSADLEFDAHPMNGYELWSVEKEANGERIAVTDDPNYKISTSQKEVDGHSIDFTRYKVSKPTAGEKNINVYVTFKHPDAVRTPNLFVKSYVRTGTGVADPAGILIYSRNDTVEIGLSTKPDDTWLVKGEVISEFENLDNVTGTYDFPTQEKNNVYRYDTLTDSIGLGAVFVEKGYPVEGYIDLGQDGTASVDKILTGATVRFVRLDDEGIAELPKTAEYVTLSQKLRHNSLFHVDLPAGHWNVYVTKQGYVQYKITDFVMTAPANETDITQFGLSDDGTVQHQIVPYIGSTKTGTTISLTDASGVKSGMRSGLSAIQKAKADVDNDDNVTAVDLAYVWFNYNRYAFEQPYSDFKTRGSLTRQYV